MFNNCPSGTISSDYYYVHEMKEKMDRAREIASKNIQRAQLQQKSYYDKKATSAELQSLAFNGPHKICRE